MSTPYIPDEFYHYRIYTWQLVNGATGQEIAGINNYNGATLQVYGVFGSGGNLRMEGTMDTDMTTAEWAILHDSTTSDLDITTAGITTFIDLPHAIRPRITAGDANTNLTVKLRLSIE